MVGEGRGCPAWAEHSLTRKREGAVHAGQALNGGKPLISGGNRTFPQVHPRAVIPLLPKSDLT